MINVIDQIIEIDKNAREQVSDAGDEARRILEDAAEKINELKREYNERAEKRLALVNETYSRFADEEIGVILSKRDRRISALKSVMEENKPRYEKEILSKILGEI